MEDALNPNLPPAPPVTDVAVPGSMPLPSTPTPNPEWPVKKKNKVLPVLGGVLAIVLVIGVAFGAFYFTRNLNQAAVPTAPTENPYAAACMDPNNSCAKAKDNGDGTWGPCDNTKEYCKQAASGCWTCVGTTDCGSNQIYCAGCIKACRSESKTCNAWIAEECSTPTPTKNKAKKTPTPTATPTPTPTATPTCTVTSWTPDTNTVCVNTSFVQTNNCQATRSATGTKTGGTCTSCTDTTWTPNPNTVCSDETLTQTSNCGTERDVDGTKECGTPDLSMEKRAYRDESANVAGTYHLTHEIDTISKDQVFVYAFAITNAGTAKAENITVTDTLKGDNQELLTFVDSDSRCSYASSTRKVTCTGMSIDPDKSGNYIFRVKVSSSAVNGDFVSNTGTLTYKDMPTDGAIDASMDLAISTVVGCDHVCTTDAECSSGLTCDPDTNKCRKPACTDSSTCNCAVVRENTTAPTRTATQVAERVQPTVLPETGILDFPGIATFGGGLLLAIVGILLAL